jgi:hypothetical protein
MMLVLLLMVRPQFESHSYKLLGGMERKTHFKYSSQNVKIFVIKHVLTWLSNYCVHSLKKYFVRIYCDQGIIMVGVVTENFMK